MMILESWYQNILYNVDLPCHAVLCRDEIQNVLLNWIAVWWNMWCLDYGDEFKIMVTFQTTKKSASGHPRASYHLVWNISTEDFPMGHWPLVFANRVERVELQISFSPKACAIPLNIIAAPVSVHLIKQSWSAQSKDVQLWVSSLS